jgi:ribonucleoside-diphosphate reductase alpha chain
MRVTKRNGSLEALDLSKIHKVLEWAVAGNSSLPSVKGVSVSQIELAASLKFHDKMKTSAIHEALISSAAALITEDTPNYDVVAGRLVWFAVRKEAFGQNTPPPLLQVVKANCASGRYDPFVLNLYSEEEWGVIDSFVDHTRDDLFRYAGAEQMRRKYLAQDRRTKRVRIIPVSIHPCSCRSIR